MKKTVSVTRQIARIANHRGHSLKKPTKKQHWRVRMSQKTPLLNDDSEMEEVDPFKAPRESLSFFFLLGSSSAPAGCHGAKVPRSCLLLILVLQPRARSRRGGRGDARFLTRGSFGLSLSQ